MFLLLFINIIMEFIACTFKMLAPVIWIHETICITLEIVVPIIITSQR